ncbi:MAG: hypothetical protein ACYCT9_09730 [Leptospirillum sp.]|jgi:hypothetical protein
MTASGKKTQGSGEKSVESGEGREFEKSSGVEEKDRGERAFPSWPGSVPAEISTRLLVDHSEKR